MSSNKNFISSSRVVVKNKSNSVRIDAGVIPPKINYTGNKEVGKTVVVLVTDGLTTRQMTVHHPIGYTKLFEDDWVLSESSEIPNLLKRAEHPRKQLVEDALTADSYKAAVKDKGCPYTDRNGTLYFGEVKRSDLTAMAHKDAKARWNSTHPLPERQVGKKAVARPKMPSNYWLDFLTSECKIAEVTFQGLLNSYREKLSSDPRYVLPDYETSGGLSQDIPQKALEGFRGISEDNIADAIVSYIAVGKPKAVPRGDPGPAVLAGTGKPKKKPVKASSAVSTVQPKAGSTLEQKAKT